MSALGKPIAKERSINIANIVKQQIPMKCLMSMGAHTFRFIKNSERYEGGLAFEFQNTSLVKKGRIYVQLTWSDDYTVTLIGIDYKKEKIFKVIKSVYAPELGQTLDKLVESEETLKTWKH